MRLVLTRMRQTPLVSNSTARPRPRVRPWSGAGNPVRSLGVVAHSAYASLREPCGASAPGVPLEHVQPDDRCRIGGSRSPLEATSEATSEAARLSRRRRRRARLAHTDSASLERCVASVALPALPARLAARKIACATCHPRDPARRARRGATPAPTGVMQRSSARGERIVLLLERGMNRTHRAVCTAAGGRPAPAAPSPCTNHSDRS